MRLRVTGEGDAPLTGEATDPNVQSTNGDLYVLIRVSPDPKFSRQGSDITYTATVPLTTAILGGQIQVPTLDGETKVKIGDDCKLIRIRAFAAILAVDVV